MDGVVYLSHHSKNERSLNKPLKTPRHLMNHGICFRSAGADACFMPACGAFCLRNDEEVMGMLILGAVLVLLAAGCLSVRLRLALQCTDETNSGACRRRGLLPADASHRLFDLRQLCGKYNRLLEKLPAKIVGRLLGFRNAEILSREAIDSLIRQGISR